MKIVPIAAGAAVLAGAALTATAWITGSRIEQQFHQGLSQTAGVQASVLRYDRGIFNATAQTLWTYDDGSGPVSLRANHRIQHGPLPSGKLAEIETELEASGEFLAVFGAALGGRAPLEVSSMIGWDGKQQHRFNSVAFNGQHEELAFDWAGLNGHLDISADGTRATGTFIAPRMRISDDEGGSLAAESLAATIDARRAPGYGFWIGPGHLTVDQLSFQETANGDAVQAHGVRLDVDTVLRQDLVDIVSRLGVRQLSAPPYGIEDFSFGLTFGNLDAGALQAVDALGASLSSGIEFGDAESERVLQALQEQVPVVLRRAPFVELDEIAGRVEQGQFTARARLGYQGDGDIERFNPLNDLNLRIALQVPAEFARDMLVAQVTESVMAFAEAMGMDDPAQIQQAIDEMVDAQIAEFIDGGLIVAQGDAWSADARYENGGLTLNGESADELLFELLGPMLFR